jgi:pimeloyl-ACP methyl ester carboxylesterase
VALTRTVIAADGRRLAVEESGKPTGHPVFLMHGTPGCRLGPRPRPMVLYQLGIRLIAFDRPGYGGSDRAFGRSVADVAQDVTTIADVLGLSRFAVLGRSGGGPHALACAALLSDRVTRAAVLVGLAPVEAEGLDWFAGMTPANVEAFAAARLGVRGVGDRLARAAARISADPAALFADLREGLTDADRRTVADVGIRRMLLSNFAEALRSSAAGWIDDVIALVAPWGFDPAAVARPTVVWHGADDRFSPAGHASWLAARIPGARLVLHRGGSHFSAIDVIPGLLPWLAGSERLGL